MGLPDILRALARRLFARDVSAAAKQRELEAEEDDADEEDDDDEESLIV